MVGILYFVVREKLLLLIIGVVFLVGSFCYFNVWLKEFLNCIFSVDEINDVFGLIWKLIDYFLGEFNKIIN